MLQEGLAEGAGSAPEGAQAAQRISIRDFNLGTHHHELLDYFGKAFHSSVRHVHAAGRPTSGRWQCPWSGAE